MGDGGDLSIPKVMAVAGVAPLAILFLLLALRAGWQSAQVVISWTRAEAKVSESPGERTLSLALPGGAIEVERAAGFDDVKPGDAVPVLLSPEHAGTVRRASFGELWLNAVIFAAFAVVLGGLGAFMYQHRPDEDLHRARAAFDAAIAAPARAPTVAPVDDGQPLVLREPSQAWRANLFWGLLFGLLLVVPSIFAPADVAPLKRWGLLILGVIWMTALGAMALRNAGRSVVLQGDQILVTSPFGARWVPLGAVARLERHDVRQELRDLEAVGRSTSRTTGLDTRAATVVYELKDAQGSTLLRLDQDMRPPEAMRRFLDRIEHRLRPR